MKTLEELINEAEALNKEKKSAEIIKLLPDSILEKHNDAVLYRYRGNAYMNNFTDKNQKDVDTNQAIEYYNKAISIDPKSSIAYNNLGKIYNDLKKYDIAIEYYKKAIEINPKYSFPYNGLGNSNKEKKEYDMAIEYYKKAIEIDQNYSYPYAGLGSVYLEKKEYEKAIQYYKKATEIDPKYPNPYIGLGNIYTQKKEYNVAKKYYEKAIEIDPNFSASYNGLGNVYANTNEYNKAIQVYRKVIENDPNFSPAYNGLGIVYKRKKDYMSAIKYYEKAIEIDKEYSNSYFNLGNVYLELNQYENAKQNFLDYIRLVKDIDRYNVKIAKSKIEEINNNLENSVYKKINEVVNEIRSLLLFKGSCVTHYTGISIAQKLILEDSQLRLSEGAFLNDTSEGQELFKYLSFSSNPKSICTSNSDLFNKKPFIGSFVDESKHNDLTLWRMYGKEAREEAKGCAITIDVEKLKDSIKYKLISNIELSSNDDFDELEFYKVAYNKEDYFHFADATKDENEQLNRLMETLKKAISNFNKKGVQNSDIQVKITELLNEIAFLFKSNEYQFENEIRLVIKEGIGFDKIVDSFFTPPRVYIELSPITTLIKKITIGPKVEKADEWASAFYYHLNNQNKEVKTEIHISNLPFK